MPVWVHTVMDMASAPVGMYLYGVHVASDGGVWVWGKYGDQVFETDSPPNVPVVRYWDGSTWHNRDLPNPGWSSGGSTHYSIQTMSVYALPGGSAFASPDLDASNGAAGNVKKWVAGAWVDQLNLSGCWLVGTSASDITALEQQPFGAADSGSVNYQHWNGSSWGGLQAAPISGLDSGTSFWGGWRSMAFFYFDGYGRAASISPDGTIFYSGRQMGGGNHSVIVMMQGGSADVVWGSAEYARWTYNWSYSTIHIWSPNNDYVHLWVPDNFGEYNGFFWDRTTYVSGRPNWQETGNWLGLQGTDGHPPDWWLGVGNRAQHDYPGHIDSYPVPWDGTADYLTVRVIGLHIIASNDIWAVGHWYNMYSGVRNGVVWHWNGSAWAIHTVFTE